MARRAPSTCAELLGGSTPPGGAWPTQSQLETVGGMMFEDLMHLTASLDLRAQSERCVSTIIFYACASSGVADGGYAAAICGRAPLEKVRQAHTGPSTRSVRDMRMWEKVALTTLTPKRCHPQDKDAAAAAHRV